MAFALPVPVIFGLEETIDGTLLEYLSEKGLVSFAVEGGQQHQPSTVDHHEAVIWIALHNPTLAQLKEPICRRLVQLIPTLRPGQRVLLANDQIKIFGA